MQAKVNIARTSLKTQWTRGKKSVETKAGSSAIQVLYLPTLKIIKYGDILCDNKIKLLTFISLICIFLSKDYGYIFRAKDSMNKFKLV